MKVSERVIKMSLVDPTPKMSLQLKELLTKAEQITKGAYAIRQMRSNDTEALIHSAPQKDAAFNMK